MKLFTEKSLSSRRFLFLLYTLGLAAILPYAFYYINNPDSFQYISIAQKLADGHFALAINGYWSPMISWLLAIPVFFGMDGVIAFKLLQCIIAFFCIDAWFSLLSLMGFGSKYKRLLGIAIIPFVLSYSILILTPDFLFLTLSLYIINIFLKNEWMNSRRGVLRLGFLGACLYFTKAFGFPFFISLLILSIVFSFFEKDRKNVLKNYLPVLVVFISITSLWILPLSMKYGQFTLSRVAAFNLSKEVSPLPGQTVYLPVLSGPLIAPSDLYAISAWESPGEHVNIHPLKPFQSSEDFNYYLQIVKRNLQSIWYYDFRHQLGGIFILILIFFLLFRKKKERVYDKNFLFLLAVIFLFYGGYSLILVNTRYIWICTLLMLLLSLYLLEKIDLKNPGNYLVLATMYIALLISVKRPMKEILFTKDFSIPALWLGKSFTHPLSTMSINYRPEKFLHKAIKELKLHPEMHGRIASFGSFDSDRGNYSSSLFIAHQFNTQYFGLMEPSTSAESMKEQLLHFEVKILLVWNHADFPVKDEEWVKEIYFNSNLGLRVYGLF